jgi:hypothetical protein
MVPNWPSLADISWLPFGLPSLQMENIGQVKAPMDITQ